MDPLYINLFFVIILIIVLSYSSINEKKDVYNLNKKFEEIKTDIKCLQYLQSNVTIPTWRFSIISSAGYTGILLSLYIIAGYKFTSTTYLIFWLLFFFNAFFLYKSIATRNYHYLCKDQCDINW